MSMTSASCPEPSPASRQSASNRNCCTAFCKISPLHLLKTKAQLVKNVDEGGVLDVKGGSSMCWRPMSVGIVYRAHMYPSTKRRGLLHHERKCKIGCGRTSE
ncbi:hypothetical protein SCLCIDRAFT_1224773 [Scleroderma citrinum Foug A]|uniref:Uncharacterized protein n=1 Tax=Scleroderma citrinum Foug A TaxID=1036808 RepID=A0A0C2ZE15_9AGAM|nr:hypothetical protein SCLCIDRAFT_1224773 [Scleroderma citrinum Foug A]